MKQISGWQSTSFSLNLTNTQRNNQVYYHFIYQETLARSLTLRILQQLFTSCFDMKFKEECIQLVRYDPLKDKFIPNKQALALLTALDKPISVISVTGVYRTGKSYLLNQLILNRQNYSELPNNNSISANKNNGFGVGSTTEAMTKGLWMWGTPLLSTDQQFYHIIVDSEGIASVDQDMSYDGKILMLCFLLSSTVIYNSIGTIDQTAIENLSAVLELKKIIANQTTMAPNSSDTHSFQKNVESPKLVWILRDFSLHLCSPNGENISENEYLEMALNESGGAENFHMSQNGTSDETRKKKNMIRKTIKQAFPNRECFTLVRPLLDQSKLQNLQENKPNLRPEFVEKVRRIRKTLFENIANCPKMLNKSPVSGLVLAKMLNTFVEGINAHNYPELVSTWDRVCELSTRELHSRLFAQLEERLRQLKLPQHPDILKKSLREAISQTLSQFSSKAYHGSSLYEQLRSDLAAQANKKYKYLKNKNRQLNEQRQIQEMGLLYNRSFKGRLESCDTYSQFQSILNTMAEEMKMPATAKFFIGKIQDAYGLHSAKKQIDKDRVLQENARLKKQLEFHSEWKSRYEKLKQDLDKMEKKSSNLILDTSEKQKSMALLNHRVEMLTGEIEKLKETHSKRVEQLVIVNKEMEENSKRKREELTSIVKLLKEENEKLMDQKDRHPFTCRQESIVFGSANQTVDVGAIEDKLKECLIRFDEERKSWTDQSKQYMTTIAELNAQIKEHQAKIKEDGTHIQKLRKSYAEKEVFFTRQIQELKKNLQDTKSEYSKTCATYKNNNEILKIISNFKNNDNAQASDKCGNCDFSASKRGVQNKQNILQQDISQKNSEIQSLKLELKRLNNKLQKQEEKTSEAEESNRRLQEHYRELQEKNRRQVSQMDSTRLDREKQLQDQIQQLRTDKQLLVDRFELSIQNLVKAKEKERTMYQESITRLLLNIEKRENQKQMLMGMDSHNSSIYRASEFGRSKGRLHN